MAQKDFKNISEEWKLKGNKSFTEGRYEESIKFYDEAIKANPSNALLFSNRAMANLKLQRFFDAESDCSKALALNDSLDKAYYRRGLSRKELHMYKSALADFNKALDLSPTDGNVKKEYESLKAFLSTTSKVRIYPLAKANQFQSTSPMREVSIQNDNETPSTQAEIAVDLADNIKKLISSRRPENYSQFEYDWRQLSAFGIADKVEYLEMISITSLQNIFKFPFEPKILLEVLQALSHSMNHLFTLQILQLITNMPRFNLNVCFFSKEEFEVLGTIFHNLLSSNELMNSNKEQILSLAKAFNVNLDC